MSSRLDCISDWKDRAIKARFRVEQLAKNCGVTERHLRRYFLTRFGNTPHERMTAWRLEAVKPLLSQGKLIKEAANAAGFRQQSHFTRQFKRQYKVIPSVFRAE